MAEQIVVVGVGGFGRETIDIIRALNAAAVQPVWDLVGIVDDAPSQINLGRLEALGVPFLGAVDELADMSDVAVAVGVGAPQTRAALVARLTGWGHTIPNLVHPTVVMGSQFATEVGLIACAQVSVGTNVTLGRHVHLNPHAVIGHDTEIEDFVSVNPNATVSGECTIGELTLVGAASVVLQGLKIGERSVVGAAACVTSEVFAGATVTGVPAKPRTNSRSEA